MLQPETIERLRILRSTSATLIRALADLDADAGGDRPLRVPAFSLLVLAEHLAAWERWAAHLEEELSTP